MDFSDDSEELSGVIENEASSSFEESQAHIGKVHSYTSHYKERERCPKLTPGQLAAIQLTVTALLFVGIMVGLSFFIKSQYFDQFMNVRHFFFLQLNLQWTQDIGPWGTLLTGGLLALAGFPWMIG